MALKNYMANSFFGTQYQVTQASWSRHPQHIANVLDSARTCDRHGSIRAATFAVGGV
jgi:hypothetical protein